MTPQDPQSPTPDDRGLSQLYRRTRREQPSAELDRAVLAEARLALARRRRRRWLVPLSTAAVLVLGVSLTLYELEAPRPTALEPQAPPPPVGEAAPAAGAMSDRAAERPAPRLPRSAVSPRLQETEEALSKRAPSAERDAPEALAPATKAETGPAPEVWIARLLEQLERGDSETLRSELESFRERYPDYPLPAPLKALAPQRVP